MGSFLILAAYTGKRSVVAVETAGFTTTTPSVGEHSVSHFVE